MACGVGVGGAEAATRVCPHAAAHNELCRGARGSSAQSAVLRQNRQRWLLIPRCPLAEEEEEGFFFFAERNSKRFAGELNGLLSTFIYKFWGHNQRTTVCVVTQAL